jgi:hypothetical protein
MLPLSIELIINLLDIFTAFVYISFILKVDDLLKEFNNSRLVLLLLISQHFFYFNLVSQHIQIMLDYLQLDIGLQFMLILIEDGMVTVVIFTLLLP